MTEPVVHWGLQDFKLGTDGPPTVGSVSKNNRAAMLKLPSRRLNTEYQETNFPIKHGNFAPRSRQEPRNERCVRRG
jgi:hypothetical protein